MTPLEALLQALGVAVILYALACVAGVSFVLGRWSARRRKTPAPGLPLTPNLNGSWVGPSKHGC